MQLSSTHSQICLSSQVNSALFKSRLSKLYSTPYFSMNLEFFDCSGCQVREFSSYYIFPYEVFDSVAATTDANSSQFLIPEGFCHLSECHCGFVRSFVQFVTFRLFSGHFEFVLHYPQQQCLFSNII